MESPTPWKAEEAVKLGRGKFRCSISDGAGIVFAHVDGASAEAVTEMAMLMAAAPILKAAAMELHNFIGNNHPNMAELPIEVQSSLFHVRTAG